MGTPMSQLEKPVYQYIYVVDGVNQAVYSSLCDARKDVHGVIVNDKSIWYWEGPSGISDAVEHSVEVWKRVDVYEGTSKQTYEYVYQYVVRNGKLVWCGDRRMEEDKKAGEIR